MLAVEIEGQIETEVGGERRTGYDTVLDIVASARTMPDIFAIADELTDRGYGRVAVDLLGRVEAVVHERTDGGAIAEFIDRMMARDVRPRTGMRLRRSQHWQPEEILRNVALTNDPARLLGVIAGLTQLRRYDACRVWLEKGVVQHFNAQELAALPLMRRRDHLPAVLQLLIRAVRTPKYTQPAQVAAVIAALRDAGASPPEVRRFALFTGGARDLDYDQMYRRVAAPEPARGGGLGA